MKTKTIGDVIRRRREAAGLSCYALGTRAGLSTDTVGLIESGRSQPTYLTVRRLAAALGCSVGDLDAGLPPVELPTAELRGRGRPKSLPISG